MRLCFTQAAILLVHQPRGEAVEELARSCTNAEQTWRR